ncbi:MAG: pilus assembly protein PilM [Deltaproteobacteria bacterium]|nr:pilus assembly protein PilM [Deltaproteobacteria bacterium]
MPAKAGIHIKPGVAQLDTSLRWYDKIKLSHATIKFMWQFGPKLSVGVDLDAQSVKIACLLKQWGKYKLVSYGIFPREQTNGIKAFLEDPKLKKASFRVSMQDTLFKARRLELPPAPEHEVPKMLEMALNAQLPKSPEHYILRYQPLQKSAFIAEKSVLDLYVKELEDFGIYAPKILEPKANSLATSTLYNHPLKPGVRYTLVDIGQSTAIFLVISKEGLLFSRNLSEASGDELNKQISKSMDISITNVTKLVAKDPNFLSIKNPEAKAALIQWLYKVTIEIQNSIENYQIHFPEDHIQQQLFITGGACQISGLSSYISDTLKLPAQLLEPFAQLDRSGFPKGQLENISHYFGTAIGLAL